MNTFNKSQRVSKRPAGLIGLLAAGLVGMMPMGDAKATVVQVNGSFSGVNSTSTYVGQYEGATSGFDSGFDTLYSPMPTPAVNNYSTSNGINYSEQYNSPTDPFNYTIIMQPSGTTGTVNGNVQFWVDDYPYTTGQPVSADIYINNTLVYDDIDIREASETHTPYSLTLNPGDTATISVVPEPAALVGLASMALAGLGIYGYRKRKNKNPAKKRIDSYFEE
ncbi:PEP-CTERM sorting domain-containing protein [Candidatus Pacearchaeota archaeon]|nr:PEP-CTERM sorting domain-containing protein [Candidatus Pacearchaeota archaeon]